MMNFFLAMQLIPKVGKYPHMHPNHLVFLLNSASQSKLGNIEVGVNLPANGDLKDPAAFNFNDSDTYNRSTSSTVYDSMGQSYKLTTYYLKDQTQPNTWQTYYTMTDGEGEKPVNITGGDATNAAGSGRPYNAL